MIHTIIGIVKNIGMYIEIDEYFLLYITAIDEFIQNQNVLNHLQCYNQFKPYINKYVYEFLLHLKDRFPNY